MPKFRMESPRKDKKGTLPVEEITNPVQLSGPVTVSTGTLCTRCLSIFRDEPKARWKTFCNSPADLAHTAATNCYICHIMYKEFIAAGGLDSYTCDPFLGYSFHEADEYIKTPYLTVSGWNDTPDDPEWMGLRRNFALVRIGSDGDFQREVLRPIYSDSNGSSCRAVAEESNTDYPTNTGHPDVAALVLSWLRLCRANHQLCAKDYDPGFYPKRLLDVSGGQLRLIFSEWERPTGPYFTLTHCWGVNPEFLTLGTDNIDQFKLGISLDDLPLTFVNAVETTRRLCIRYLWIDSLCIIQRGILSADDWLVHSSVMDQIYFNGMLNLSASCAKNAKEGFFVERQTDLIRPCTVVWDGFKSYSNSLYRVLDTHIFGEQLASWPTGKRAWVLQERLLSPRVVHFGPVQVFWECQELSCACETFPGGIESPLRGNSGTVTDFTLRGRSLEEASEKAEAVDDWYGIVGNYSALALSEPMKDKYLALAGIARRAAKLRDDVYVAGFFRRQLPQALLWDIPHRMKDELKTRIWEGAYRAPSWSWASVEGPISAGPISISKEGFTRYLASVEDVNIRYVDRTNPFGQIESAEITLKGFLLSTSRRAYTLSEPYLITHTSIGAEDKHLSIFGYELDCACNFDGRREKGNTGNNILMPLCEELKRSSPTIYGLILDDTDQRGCYARLGTFRIAGFDSDKFQERKHPVQVKLV